jgi:hypothetical protein
LQAGDETRVAGVIVSLLNSDNKVVGTTITDANGLYFFNNIQPNTYNVAFSNFPAGTSITTPNVGNNTHDAIDSDISTSTGKSITPYILAGGQYLHAADAGILPPASIRGMAFEDAGQSPNGLSDGNEIRFFGITVRLYDESMNLLNQTYTDKNGKYAFTGLSAGNYIVEFESLNGRTFTQKDVQSNAYDANDSDVDMTTGQTDIISLSVGENEINWDGGYLQAGMIFPVELVYFTAELVNTDAALKWQTSLEMNSDYFEVWRSVDKVSFERIIENIPAAGFSQTPKNYNDFDRNINLLNIDKVYYRLKMIDTDGTSKWSNIAELNLTHSNSGIFMNIYPNPAREDIFINFQLFESSTVDVRITNGAGQAVFEQAGVKGSTDVQELAIDVRKWARGVYYIQLQTEDANISQKVIVE